MAVRCKRAQRVQCSIFTVCLIVSDSLKGVAVVGCTAHPLALMLLMGTQATLCVGCEVLNLRFLLALASLARNGERGWMS